ncbi:unnamed protein product [Clonostachys byssicola]|uniref:Xylanolytic transcriptional activator regulatory domain-containing protein n=1 Tax=Clonostachys byssicola TaxID=160290 RepID=A0A9N9UMQ4_9HYPO|nr:unnamed protein product [Clonostachys byssicola]
MTSSAPGQYPAPAPEEAQHHQPARHEDRIRRNVACVNCRNSKVIRYCFATRRGCTQVFADRRVVTSSVAGNPCQRCAKLEIPCVVDKSHKRVTRRSKLEQLEQELKSIKQAVNTKAGGGEGSIPPPSPVVNLYVSPTEPRGDSIVVTSQETDTSPEKEATSVRVSDRPLKATPTKPRTIGAKVVDGVEIDHYFDRYLQHFHAFLPVLRKKDPDECYEECPVLFWIVILTACRRYCLDEQLHSTLVESISKDIWALVSSPVMNLEAVHALLLICVYPLPTIRFATDPSTTFATLALHFCTQLGLHTGRGSHSEFCAGQRQHISCTSEEASVTWLSACILAERCASSMGLPPPSIQLNDGPARQALSSPQWSDVIAMFEIQKFLNRMHLSMAAYITSNGSVGESIVANWEDDFESLQALVIADSEVSRFMLLAAKLEIQVYYFSYPADRPGPNLNLNFCRTFGTTKSMVQTALALDDSPSKFLAHSPHWVFRSIIDAASFIIVALHSHKPPVTVSSLSRHSETSLVEQAKAAVFRCSVRDGDLPCRGGSHFDAFWTARDMIPKIEPAVRTWPNRLGAGLIFWCFSRFTTGLKQAKEQSDSAVRAAAQTTEPVGSGEVAAVAAVPSATESTMLAADAFQDIDLSMFLDDFGWNGGDETVFMGLP